MAQDRTLEDSSPKSFVVVWMMPHFPPLLENKLGIFVMLTILFGQFCKLYLFLNEAIFREFQKDQSGTITKAEANWKKIRSTEATKL